MRYAIISDIHGNLEALKRVAKAIKHEKIDEVWCLGDIVGYGPNPNECVERVKKMCSTVVVGNHDYVMVNDSLLQDFNPLAKKAARWTKDNLKKENLQYLACLSFTAKMPDILLVHGSPISPRSFTYIFDVFSALSQFQGFQEWLCFVGHSHVPGIFCSNGEVMKDSAVLKKDQKYIINVGSVGQPRDENPQACYGILDTDSLTFSFKRIDYYIGKTAKKMLHAGLPEYLAERLSCGH